MLVLLFTLYYFRGFADALKCRQQHLHIRLAGIVGDGDSLGLQIAHYILDALLPRDVLHYLIATSLAMQVACKDYRLFGRLFGFVLRSGIHPHKW